MKTTAEDPCAAARAASSLDDLLDALSVEVYAALGGSYASLPTWGPETSEVSARIRRSSAECDIVSWDTRVPRPRYLMRRWAPAERPEHHFAIEEMEPEMDGTQEPQRR